MLQRLPKGNDFFARIYRSGVDLIRIGTVAATYYRLLFLLSFAVAVCIRVPLVPETVKVYEPGAVEELMFRVRVEDVVAGSGLKLPVVPEGRPLTESCTVELKPPVGLIVTV